ncbi:hypothetical protein PPTG_04411 [Phytophthora nicotianae INRA-310]|uniref:Uncharacterized protein n=1 Tax=Phytophthora nicotianae (strain INRA-310) TaxID=761204 RepID=W2R140_PHYN3|nr:hypothetical protein PPTG_04411 [Phytophthora nicotianae INRA-310]ETN18976.1 hypothetical protein PPTG_04411 [Phytophthora nicotianae INRA-310]
MVYYQFCQLKTNALYTTNVDGVPKQVQTKILEAIQAKRDFVHTETMGFSFLLDHTKKVSDFVDANLADSIETLKTLAVQLDIVLTEAEKIRIDAERGNRLIAARVVKLVLIYANAGDKDATTSILSKALDESGSGDDDDDEVLEEDFEPESSDESMESSGVRSEGSDFNAFSFEDAMHIMAAMHPMYCNMAAMHASAQH